MSLFELVYADPEVMRYTFGAVFTLLMGWIGAFVWVTSR